jgi:hypothetical protein
LFSATEILLPARWNFGLTVPLAFWGWRLRAGFPFPAPLDVANVAVSVVSAVLASVVLMRAYRHRPRILGLVGWSLLALDAAVVLWFSSVEWTYVVENCTACGHGRDLSESRFFWASPCRSACEFPVVTELIARDLGVPCHHEHMTRWRKYRVFGGCLWGERHDGIHRIYDPPWYPPCARDAIRSWSSSDPSFVRTFRERALEGHDRRYVRDLIFRLYDTCPDDQRPSCEQREPFLPFFAGGRDNLLVPAAQRQEDRGSVQP